MLGRMIHTVSDAAIAVRELARALLLYCHILLRHGPSNVKKYMHNYLLSMPARGRFPDTSPAPSNPSGVWHFCPLFL
jgi:hypothetical protein